MFLPIGRLQPLIRPHLGSKQAIPNKKISLYRLKSFLDYWICCMDNSSREKFKNMPVAILLESFPEAAAKDAAKLCEPTIFSSSIDLLQPVPGSQLIENLTKELEKYFRTGNSGPQDGSRANRCANPTLLDPKTRKWFVRHSACPFIGYAPLPLKELDQSGKHDWIAFGYCRTELKKLLIAFRKHQENVAFHFHPCDPLVFCYQDSPLRFDIIDCPSLLMDNVGLVNLLNGPARLLRSDQSILFTENYSWPICAPDVVGYLQSAICCPLSLIPTIYGLRLMDSVELGPETFVSTRNIPKAFARLRWKKAEPFEGASQAISPLLEQSLERLKKLCFLAKAPCSNEWKKCGMSSYSPLTFHYVMCDIIRRGGLPAIAMEAFPTPSMFRTSMQTIQAWKERRPVWRVNVCIKFGPEEKAEFGKFWNKGVPILRLILTLSSAFRACNTLEEMCNSTESHFIDNLDVNLKRTANGEIGEADISFLLTDRNLLKTHFLTVVDLEKWQTLLMFGPTAINIRQIKMAKFNQPYPHWNQGQDSSCAADRSQKLTTICCQESQDAFILLFKFRSGDQLPQSGMENDNGLKYVICDLRFSFLFLV